MQINFKLCEELDITEPQLLYLYCAFYNVDVQDLKNRELIVPGGVPDEIARKLVVEETPFDKVYDLYPHKVGSRVLKAVKHDSADYNYCKTKFMYYNRKDKDVSHKMLKGLIIELSFRNKGNSENFQQDIKTWFNQRTWEKYCDLEIEEDKVIDYGKDI